MLAVWVAFVLLGCLLLIGGCVHQFTLSRLKRHHHATWRELGEPVLIWHYSARLQFRWMGFCWSGRYRTLGDPVLNRAVVAELILFVAFLVVFLGVICAHLVAPVPAPAPGTAIAPSHAVVARRTTLPTGLGWVILPATALYFINLMLLLSRLKRRHGATWRQLGEPGLFINNTPRSALSIAWFILSLQNRHLRDRQLNILCAMQWIFVVAIVALWLR